MKLPEGWRHTPSVPAQRCGSCNHLEPERPGTLRSPTGKEWPLIGNKNRSQEHQMVRAIVKANQRLELRGDVTKSP